MLIKLLCLAYIQPALYTYIHVPLTRFIRGIYRLHSNTDWPVVHTLYTVSD